MNHYKVEFSGIIDAPPENIYAILSDYHQGHPAILPDAFSDLTVTQGGQGEGTHIVVAMEVFGSKIEYQMKVTEPEPGRVLVEEDEAAGVTTTFTLDPLNGGDQTRITIATKGKAGPGLRGAIEKLISPIILRRIYREELSLLADVARNDHGA